MSRRRDEDLELMPYMKKLTAFMKEEEEAINDLVQLMGLRNEKIPDEISYMQRYFKDHLFVFHPATLTMLYYEREHWREVHTEVNVTNIARLTTVRFLSYYAILDDEGAIHGEEEKDTE